MFSGKINLKLINVTLLFSALVLVCCFMLFGTDRPFYYYNQDVEVDYFINSLLISKGLEPWSFHHPGTIIQYLGGYIYSSFFESDLARAEDYLKAMKYVLFSINIIIFSYIYITRKNVLISNQTLFLVSILLIASPSFLYYSDYLSTDSLIVSFSLLMFIDLWDNLNSKENHIKRNLFSTFIMALAMSLKIAFVPFILAALIALLIKEIQSGLNLKRSLIRFIILPISFSTFFLIINFPIIEKIPYLFFYILYQLLSLGIDTMILSVVLLLFFLFLLFFIFQKSLFNNFFIWLKNSKRLPYLSFLIMGSCIFFLSFIKIDFLNYYDLGLQLRNFSPYLVFVLFMIAEFIKKKKKYLNYVTPLVISVFITSILLFNSSRNDWIENFNLHESYLQNLVNESLDKKFLIWTGSGSNNFLKQTFFMWGDYRYSNEQFQNEFYKLSKNIRMLRLRSLPKENLYTIRNSNINLIEKLSNFKISLPSKSNPYSGEIIDKEKVVVILPEKELRNEFDSRYAYKEDFKKLIETIFDREFQLNVVNKYGIIYLVYE